MWFKVVRIGLFLMLSVTEVHSENVFTMSPQEAEEFRNLIKNCEKITREIVFCPATTEWQRSFARGATTAAFVSSYQHELGTSYNAQIIAERLEYTGQISIRAAKNAITTTLSDYATTSGGWVEFLVDEQRSTQDGRPRTILAYRTELEGIPMVFVNSIVIGSSYAAQIITWRLGTELDHYDYEVHESFFGTLRMAP